MAIKAIVESLDEVDEKYRDLYTEQDGKYVLTGVEDVLLLPAVKALKTENGARRISEKKAKDDLAKWTGAFPDRKPEEVQADIGRIPELEAASEGKLDDKKINAIVENRIAAKIAPVQRKLDETTKLLNERDQTIAGHVQRERTRTIHDAVTEAVVKSQGFQPSAKDDALMYAERHFEINEEGKVVTKDGVGVTPGVDAVVWLTEMQNKKAHWWGETKGGGGSGNNNRGAGNGKNPFSRADWNMTEQGRILRENPTRAEQLAKAAGTSVGGPMPAK